jgi:hypothetical protein
MKTENARRDKNWNGKWKLKKKTRRKQKYENNKYKADSESEFGRGGRGFGFVIDLRPQTTKHVRGGWSHYTDTSEPVDGNGAQNIVTVQSGFEPATFRSLVHELTNCSNQAHKGRGQSGNTGTWELGCTDKKNALVLIFVNGQSGNWNSLLVVSQRIG